MVGILAKDTVAALGLCIGNSTSDTVGILVKDKVAALGIFAFLTVIPGRLVERFMPIVPAGTAGLLGIKML